MYIKICKHCNEEIYCEKQQQFASHVSCCKSNPRERIYKTKERFNYSVNCEKCKNDYIVNLTEYNYIKNNYSKYCSRSCANSHAKTDSQKEAISIINKNSEKVKEANIQSGINRRIYFDEKHCQHREEQKNYYHGNKSLNKIKRLYNDTSNINLDVFYYVKVENVWYKYYQDLNKYGKIYIELDNNKFKIATLIVCELCKKDILILKYKGVKKYHTDCWRSVSGGIRKGSSNGKCGYYKDFWCDSSYELSFIYYCLDNDIKIQRNYKGFEYNFENKIKKFYPDFIVNGEYVEIKNYHSDITDAKISQFPHNIKIYYKEDIKFYIDYVVNKIGKDYINILYQINPPPKIINNKDKCECGCDKIKTNKQCRSCYLKRVTKIK